jgi:uncharacterized protein (TIGR02145 family)
MRKMIFLMLTLMVLGAASVNAQVTIGSDNLPHAGAVLDLQSTTQGLKFPAVSLSDVSSFQLAGDPSQAVGMVVYNTNGATTGGIETGTGLFVWDGYVWKPLAKKTTPCPSSVTDIDGNVYSAKQFGALCWMTQNLRVTRTPDGTPLDSITLNGGFQDTENAAVYVNWVDDGVQYTTSGNSGEGATYTEDGVGHINESWDTFASKFGFGYPWYQAMKACPSGWHLGTTSDYDNLIASVAHTRALKSARLTYVARDNAEVHWWSGYGTESLRSGWDALPTGNVAMNRTRAVNFGLSFYIWMNGEYNEIGERPVLRGDYGFDQTFIRALEPACNVQIRCVMN